MGVEDSMEVWYSLYDRVSNNPRTQAISQDVIIHPKDSCHHFIIQQADNALQLERSQRASQSSVNGRI
jgi:hypothetical protein